MPCVFSSTRKCRPFSPLLSFLREDWRPPQSTMISQFVNVCDKRKLRSPKSVLVCIFRQRDRITETLVPFESCDIQLSSGTMFSVIRLFYRQIQIKIDFGDLNFRLSQALPHLEEAGPFNFYWVCQVPHADRHSHAIQAGYGEKLGNRGDLGFLLLYLYVLGHLPTAIKL